MIENAMQTRLCRRMLAAAALLCPSAALADEVLVYDGRQIAGSVVRLDAGHLEVRAEGEQDLQRIPLGNVQSVKFVTPLPSDPVKAGYQLLIDNDGDHAPTEKSAKIKLKQGLHQFTLLYFQGSQGASLSLQWEGPGVKRQPIPRNAFFRWKQDQSEINSSPGVDAQGLREPDEIAESLRQIGYKLFEWPESRRVKQVADLRDIPLKQYGSLRQIDLNFPHAATNFGAVFYGLIKVPADGEYTFYLNSDDGSQLYIGKTPPAAQPSIREPEPGDWSAELADGGHVDAPLSGWSDAGAQLTFKIGGKEYSLNIPPAGVRELWSREVASGKTSVDRRGEVDDADNVYAKNADGQVQRVSGEIVGIEGASLKFQFQQQERSIGMERVLGIVPRKADSDRQPPADDHVRLLLDLCGPYQFPVRLTKLDRKGATVETRWGDSLELPRNLIYQMTVLNGRMQPLPELTPSEVTQTPFFDRILQWQANRSLTGGTLKIGETSYQTGLCLHSRTKLTYDLNGKYERLQSDLGLQRPEGDAGNATVRIAADGAELFVADEVTADAGPQTLDLDVSGKQRLTLEVDFGRNMHIGDHVVFGNARLLRPELAP